MLSRRLRIKQDRWLTLGELERDLPDLTGWPTKRVAEARSALNLLCRVVGRPLSEIPADPEPIRKLLEDAPWQVHDVKKARWANAKSLIVSTLHQVGVLSIRSRQRRCLLPGWQSLLALLPEAGLAQKLSRFARWCSSKGINPEHLAIETFERFATELTELSLVKEPREQMHVARRAWNKAVEQVTAWPQLRVPSPEDRLCYSLPWEAFSQSLQDEVADYRQKRLTPDPFDDEHSPIRPITVRQHLDQLRRHASRLVQDGVARDDLVNLTILLKPELVKRSLLLQLGDQGQTTPRASATANALCAVAQYLDLPGEQVCELRRMASRLRYRPNGMTAKNKERLGHLRPQRVLQKLSCLPPSIAQELEKVKKPEYRHATRMRLAVAIEILLMTPMRVANLAALDLGQHFGQLNVGHDEEIQISIPADEVKNCKPLEFVLPQPTARILNSYRQRFRPLLLEAPSSKLFPCRSGGAMNSASLARAIRDGIKRELGLTINAHLFRHLGAFLYLSRHPGDYETVRRVLGHKSINTTVTFYAGIEMEHSMRRFDEVMLQLRNKNSDLEDADVL
jgi:integrase